MASSSELPAPTGHREVLVTIALIGIATLASVAVFGW
jgi:hypothetical protein